jgi:hypothetical protein
MKNVKITLLNSAILTAYGIFDYKFISLEEAKLTVRTADEVQSGIGHASTAEILAELLEFPVDKNRFEYKQETGETALIFRLKQRPSEGKILNRAEIEEIGYEFGLLRRLK